MECVLLVADDDGVPGVVASVELDDVVDATAEQVGRPTLAFVAPLGAGDEYRGHLSPFPAACARASDSLPSRRVDPLPRRLPPPPPYPSKIVLPEQNRASRLLGYVDFTRAGRGKQGSGPTGPAVRGFRRPRSPGSRRDRRRRGTRPDV